MTIYYDDLLLAGTAYQPPDYGQSVTGFADDFVFVGAYVFFSPPNPPIPPPTPTPTVLDTDQASNWQADYWKHRSKKKRKKDDDEERIKLGILPAPERATVDAAIAEASRAAVELDPPEALLAKMEAREAYEQAYRDAYAEAYDAAVVAENWKRDLENAIRRRKKIMLLLH